MIKAYHAMHLLQKVKGLTGKKPFPLFFQTHFGIHTFGMTSSLDIVILDDSFRIKKIKENLLPNRIFLWNILYKNVLELPPGTIKSKNLRLGKTITLHFVPLV